MIPFIVSRRLAFMRVQLREAFPELGELRIRRLALAQYLRGRRGVGRGGERENDSAVPARGTGSRPTGGSVPRVPRPRKRE